jgi:aryl-alcohol dehydrogenase-like predicted oxidoreductase
MIRPERCATVLGTAAYAARLRQRGTSDFHVLRSGLTCSRIGFSGRRISGLKEHRDALMLALRSGINVLDTSGHYLDGRSETTVGSVLDQMFGTGEVKREEVILLSKFGRIVGRDLSSMKAVPTKEVKFGETVRYNERLWYCIDPDFLGERIRQTIQRLGITTLDVCLLHDPEYLLRDALERGHSLHESHERLRRQLCTAFAFLAGEVAAGRIRSYGVSSETLVHRPGTPEHISVESLVDIASSVDGGGHHLRYVQVPLNLLESRAAMAAGDGRSVLQRAVSLGLDVIACRPLGARGHRAVRLSTPASVAGATDIAAVSAKIGRLEVEYGRSIGPYMVVVPGGFPFRTVPVCFDAIVAGKDRIAHPSPDGTFARQELLGEVDAQLHAIGQRVPRVRLGVWKTWSGEYFREVRAFVDVAERMAHEEARRRTDAIDALISPITPAERRTESLARKALWIVASTPGVACVVNGMRKPAYVADALNIMSWNAFEATSRVYSDVRRLELVSDADLSQQAGKEGPDASCDH